MQVLIVGPVPPEFRSWNHGGVAHHSWDLAKALSRAGHDVDVLAMGRYCRPTRKVDNINVLGVGFSLLGLFSALRAFRALNGRSPSWSLWERIHLFYTLYRLTMLPDPEMYDLVHVQGITHKAPVAWRGLGLKPPVVLTVHSYSEIIFGVADERRRLVQHRTEVYRDVDFLIHVSKTDRRKGLECGIHWDCPDRVVHHGIASTEDPVSEDTGRSGICFVGTLSERKGLSSLLDAWTDISIETTGPLRIAGEGSLATEVADFARSHSGVEYMGYLDRNEVDSLLRSSWVLVVPSRSESFGLAYAEALVRGTAVVGYSEILEEYQEVLDCTEREMRLIVPVDMRSVDGDELSDVVERAVRDRQADGMAGAAERLASKAQKYFSREWEVKEIEAAYQTVVR